MSRVLAIGGRGVRTDAVGRFCLNDVHAAAGGEVRHQPANWLRLETTKALIAELEASADVRNPPVEAKKGVGTFVSRELVYAYGMWVSPAFNLAVIRAFDALQIGAKSTAQELQAALQDPATLRALLLDQADARLRLEVEARQLEDAVVRQSPRAAAFDRLTEARGSVSLTAAAKTLGLRPHDFTGWLSGLKWIYRSHDAGSWLGHARHCDAGELEHRIFQPDNSHRQRVQVLVTPRGMARLALLLEQLALPSVLQSPSPSRHATTSE